MLSELDLLSVIPEGTTDLTARGAIGRHGGLTNACAASTKYNCRLQNARSGKLAACKTLGIPSKQEGRVLSVDLLLTRRGELRGQPQNASR